MLEQTTRTQNETGETPLNETGEQARYVVRLPVFEGPLDLLLHLIEKRQMEITTISLVAVTDQYIEYLRQWQDHPEQMPLANMSAFLSIASRLLFIKSQSLLPHSTKEDVTSEMDDAAAMAEELRTHLMEYKIAKEIANHLRQRAEKGLQTYSRSSLLAGIEAQLAWTPPTLTGLEVASLAQVFARLLELHARDEASGEELMPLARVRVSQRIAEIREFLSERSTIYLSEILEGELSRFVIIVTFLAVLELWKHARIVVKQEKLFGPILLERGERWEERDLVIEDEY
ncbi:MAG TPA: segregation/condensation protein A [Ktedonobacteraceae bacterium]|jgi:segregation and condensation protein A|nr:segregation/condensation protein A [Ktedonobacteraceae bacterium]